MVFSNVRIFQLPVWLRYLTAVVLTLLVVVMRHQVNPMLGSVGAFVFFTIPVAVSAFLGGLVPGVVATVLSLLAGTFLFLIPNGKSPVDDATTVIVIASNAAVWLFICIVCDLLRSAAIGYQLATIERDEGQARLSTVFDSMTDGFFAVDQDWNVTHLNTAFKKLIGPSAERTDSPWFWSLLGAYESPVKATFLRAQAENGPASIDVQALGSDRWLHFRVFPDHHGMAGYVQDATYRKHMEIHKERILENEKIARSDAERASQLKDEFIATLSHELRTPLTTILGWTELLLARKDNDSRTAEGLESIERSTKLQTQLVEELLDMSRMSVGKLRLNLEVMDLAEVVREAVYANLAAAEAQGVSLEMVPPFEEVFVRGDPSRMQQVTSNLISNAIKFSEKSGRVEVSVARSGAAATLVVRDNGQGIDPSFLPFLFDRFRQANASITRSRGGLGLGLAIVKQLVDMHGGTVQAKSEGLGKGSEFKIMIPVTPFLLPEEGPEESAPSDTELSASGVRILIVDDDSETRNLLNIILRDAGAEVLSAESAKAALKVLSKTTPDLIVSDIGMPEVDGYQFIRTVRNLPSSKSNQIPAIALTAFAQQSDMTRALEAGFQVYMTKPIESKSLLNAIVDLTSDVKRKSTSP